MAKVILCRGIQGIGKTAWAKQWALEDPEHRVRFNNDDVRNMLGKYWVTSREGLVRALRDTCVHRAMEILEATNRKDDYGYSVYQDADLEHVVGATYNGYEGILHQQHYLE